MSFIPKYGEKHWHCYCQKDFRTRYGLVMHKLRVHSERRVLKRRVRR